MLIHSNASRLRRSLTASALNGCLPSCAAFSLAASRQTFPTRVRSWGARRIASGQPRPAKIGARGGPQIFPSGESLSASFADAFGGVFHGLFTHDIPFDFARLF